MKKLALILILSIGFFPLIHSQTVDSIKVEQAGDKILIQYKILESNELQVFRVTLSCFLSTGLKLEPNSISGDFGENVVGGKPEYMIVWDVLKDLEELQSADFSVRAELVKGVASKQGPSVVKIPKKRFYLLAVGLAGPLNQQFGGRIGFMGDFGFSVSMLFGKKDYKEYTGEPFYDGFTSSANLTKRIINKTDFQLHLLAGATIANHESNDASRNYQDIMCSGLDIGLIAGFKRLALYAGYSRAKKPFMSDYYSDGTTWFNFGAGIRF